MQIPGQVGPSHVNPSLPSVQAPRQEAPPQEPRDSVETGTAPMATQNLSSLGRLFKRDRTASELKADIEKIYAQIVDDADQAPKEELWATLIQRSEEYLAKPESFDAPDFLPLTRRKTNDAGTTFVSIQAPRPYLAGTMSSNWNYISSRDGDKLRLQQIGSADPTHIMEARLWNDGPQPRMTLLSVAKLSTKDYVPMVSLYGRNGDQWERMKDVFVTNTDHVEGCQIFIGEDGAFGLDQSDSPVHLQLEFDGDKNSNRVVITGGQEEHSMEYTNGRYSLHVRTQEEKDREERERLMGRMIDALDRGQGGGQQSEVIVRGEDTVRIGHVELPIRKIK